MPENYPCKLPGVLINSNGYSPQSLVDQNSLDSGPPIFRLRSSDGWLQFNVAWSFSALEMQVFRAWHRFTLAHGSKSFTIGLMVDGFDGTDNTVDHECQFIGVPSYTQNGRRWSVSAQLLAVQYEGVDECNGLSLVAAFNGFDDLNSGIILLDDAVKALEELWVPL